MERKIELEEIKKLEFEVLEDIDRVCSENNIKYTLIYGTLLGAVRHKGFIPWDDDIDIGLERDEYNKFLEVYEKEKQSKFDICSNKKDAEYPFAFVKIYNNQTRIKELKNKELKDLGIFVDVFPLDKISKSNKKKRLKRLIKLGKLSYALSFNDEFYKTKPLYKQIIRKICKFFGSRFFVNWLTKECIKENNEECEEIGVLVEARGDVAIWSIRDFNKYTHIDFENKKFMAVSGYDNILRHTYGDYMKLPPDDEQVSHHYIDAHIKL